MKVLIVSFDKTLTESLKEAFSDHEVFIAKNSEEAIKMIPSDIDVVVYDAISGAISEEDINTLYTKKFSNSRYMILYDELFPVDMNNIIPPAKMRVPRDEDPSSIASKLTEIPSEAVPEEVQEAIQQASAPPEPEIEIEPTSLVEESQPEEVEPAVESVSGEAELEIEPTSLDVEEVAQEAAEMITEEAQVPEETSVEEPVEEAPVEEAPAEVQEEQPATAPAAGGNKVLIVSFDQTLIDSIRNALGGQYQVESVKTVRQAIQKGSDASVVIFDAISGVIAEKGLIDLSNDQYMKDKPYIILVDDLFPINVEGIPLDKKESLSRDTDPGRIRDLIAQIAVPAEVHQEVQEPAPVEETPPPPEPEPEPAVAEVQEEPTVQETPEIEEVPEIEPEEVEEVIEQVQEEVPAESPAEEAEEEIPALEALGKIIEEQKQEVQEEPLQPTYEATEVPSAHALSSAELEAHIKEIVTRAIDEKMTEIGGLISDLVRTEIERVFGQVDIENIVKETAYQILKEKLDQLVS